MAAPYSNDFRARVASLIERGYSRREVADLCEVGVSTVVRIGQRLAATGNADAKPMGGARHDALGAHREWLIERRRSAPDVTLHALQAELAARGLQVSVTTIWKACRQANFTFKKKRCCPASKTARTLPEASDPGAVHEAAAVVEAGFC